MARQARPPPIRLRIRLEHPGGEQSTGTGYHREIETEFPFRSDGDAVDMTGFLRRVVEGIYLDNCEGHFVPHTRAEFLRACCGATAWQNDGGLRLRFHGTDFLDVGPEAKRTTVSFHLVRRGRDGEPVCKSGDAYRCLGAMVRDEPNGDGRVSLVLVPRVGGRKRPAPPSVAAGGDDGTGKKGGGREDPTKKPPSKRARTGGVEQKGKRSGRGRKGGASNRQSPKRGLLRRAKAARTTVYASRTTALSRETRR